MWKFFEVTYSILYRRLIIYWRHIIYLITSTIALVFFSNLIDLILALTSHNNSVTGYSQFQLLNTKSINFGVIFTKDPEIQNYTKEILENVKNIIKYDTGITPNSVNLSDDESFLNYNDKNPEHPLFFAFNFSKNGAGYPKAYMHEDSVYQEKFYPKSSASLILQKAIYMYETNSTYWDTHIFYHKVSAEDSDYNQNKLVILIVCLIIIGIFPLFYTMDDLYTMRRTYLELYQLNLLAYWTGTYIADLIATTPCVIIAWAMFMFMKFELFCDHPYLSLLSIIIANSLYVEVSYFFAYMVSSKFVAFVGYAVAGVSISVVYSMLLMNEQGVLFKDYFDIPCLYPFSAPSAILTHLYYFGYTRKEQYMYTFVCFVLWFVLLAPMELMNKRIKRMSIKLSQSISENMIQVKESQKISEEAIAMEEEVRNSHPGDYKIRLVDVCKVYKDTKRKNINAVNNVSLGIKDGCLFGLLGSNGAGKTTLMNILLNQIPLMSGSIDISSDEMIGYCPQFVTHLAEELTIIQTMKFFCHFFCIRNSERERVIDLLLNSLDMTRHKNRVVSELSAGLKQKLSVAIAFMLESKIIVLDEPTSVLDPISRRKVHHLINMYKGSKTFILCTHIIEEAESLCDEITIMIDGCIHTIGSPTYLSNKFGKEWKFDLILTNGDSTTINIVEEYINNNIKTAKQLIKHHSSIIYTVPSNDISIADLFTKLNVLKNEEHVLKYYTCTSSTIENVFTKLIDEAHSNNSNNETRESDEMASLNI